jgi:hypothetical protein
MTPFRLGALAMCAATLVLAGCGKQETGADQKPGTAAPQKVVEEKPAPYTYPPPVKGHYKEINIGEFDLVDGIAYPATGGAGIVVYVTDKPIASPMLTESACPMTEARALTELRNARFAEVTLDLLDAPSISPPVRPSLAAAVSRTSESTPGRPNSRATPDG